MISAPGARRCDVGAHAAWHLVDGEADRQPAGYVLL